MAGESTSVPPRSNFGMRGVEMAAADGKGRKSWRTGKKPTKDPGEAKRTAAMTLVAIGAGAFGVWAFATSGSGKDAHGKVYNSAQACASDGAMSSDTCSRLWREALRLHTNHAPVYTTKAQCEMVHGTGRCEEPVSAFDKTRRTQYIPRMAGYAMGRLVLGGYQAAPLFKRKTDHPTQYRMSAAPEPVSDSSGRRVSAFLWMSRAKASAPAVRGGRSLWSKDRKEGKASKTRRGGFGKSSRTRAAGG